MAGKVGAVRSAGLPGKTPSMLYLRPRTGKERQVVRFM